MKINWQIGACGEYFDYKGYTVIRQIHPKLLRYEITKEDHDEELQHVAVANTIHQSLNIINKILDDES